MTETQSPPPTHATQARLRLYIARNTPNSARAERNLMAALGRLGTVDGPEVEIIDVFTSGKRASIDGVIVTPTLIGLGHAGRMMMLGDLTDTAKLELFLNGL